MMAVRFARGLLLGCGDGEVSDGCGCPGVVGPESAVTAARECGEAILEWRGDGDAMLERGVLRGVLRGPERCVDAVRDPVEICTASSRPRGDMGAYDESTDLAMSSSMFAYCISSSESAPLSLSALV
jgi:hypothetical protein